MCRRWALWATPVRGARQAFDRPFVGVAPQVCWVGERDPAAEVVQPAGPATTRWNRSVVMIVSEFSWKTSPVKERDAKTNENALLLRRKSLIARLCLGGTISMEYLVEKGVPGFVQDWCCCPRMGNGIVWFRSNCAVGRQRGCSRNGWT